MRIPRLSEAKAEKCRRHLRHFVREGWHVLEPGTPLLWNWHIDAVSDHAEAVTRGQIKNLVVNIPPGHMKSLVISVFWPAWEWIERPETRSLFSSYALELSLRDSVRFRDLITSDWYQEWFGPQWGWHSGDWDLSDAEQGKSNIANTRKGFRLAMSVGGRGTGFRGNKVVTDDPLNAKNLHSLAAREEVIFWWDKVMSSRLNDMRSGAKVIIMQRLHEQDLSGHVLAKNLPGAEGYQHLCLPSEYQPERKSMTMTLTGAKFWEDPRTVRGELLFPGLFPQSVLDQAKQDLGTDGYSGQHDQQPVPAGGEMLQDHWWRYWCLPGQKLPPVAVTLPDGSRMEIAAEELPARFDEQLQSWDMAFKDTKASDFVVGQVWGKAKANRFLLDQVRDRLSFSATLDAVTKLSVKWPAARTKLVEDKANGPAVIDTLKSRLSGLIAVEPEGGKEARCAAVSPEVESHNVYLPHPLIAGWVIAFRGECAAFPKGVHDDQVDACTQALLRMSQGKSRLLSTQ